ncbi:transducin/WD40 repeat-like superfamily protein [Artemisia annua]|uniref:Transducin/WD40 repeat-like superfamily protein n=1 Tax=Artemisia annua TaxID=35608 RepID=A0A2U1MND5_ARTAN|nr:transducin/WD40 repeat-like superfamily protein [Artemisia annua]
MKKDLRLFYWSVYQWTMVIFSKSTLHALEMESRTGSRDLRESQTLSRTVSLGANLSDIEQPGRKPEPAYSFVGMHCIFDECKSMVTVIKFGHMSSDILAYGATDGTITVCTVSDPPSVTNKLIGHSKDVTGLPKTLNNNDKYSYSYAATSSSAAPQDHSPIYATRHGMARKDMNENAASKKIENGSGSCKRRFTDEMEINKNTSVQSK